LQLSQQQFGTLDYSFSSRKIKDNEHEVVGCNCGAKGWFIGLSRPVFPRMLGGRDRP